MTDILVQKGDVSVRQLLNTIKALSDEIRLRIVNLLSCYDEVCVCEMVDALSLPQSTISRHLTVLKNAGIVEDRKQGLWVLYRLKIGKDDGSFVERLIEKELKTRSAFQADIEALEKRLEKVRGCSG